MSESQLKLQSVSDAWLWLQQALEGVLIYIERLTAWHSLKLVQQFWKWFDKTTQWSGSIRSILNFFDPFSSFFSNFMKAPASFVTEPAQKSYNLRECLCSTKACIRVSCQAELISPRQSSRKFPSNTELLSYVLANKVWCFVPKDTPQTVFTYKRVTLPMNFALRACLPHSNANPISLPERQRAKGMSLSFCFGSESRRIKLHWIRKERRISGESQRRYNHCRFFGQNWSVRQAVVLGNPAMNVADGWIHAEGFCVGGKFNQ